MIINQKHLEAYGNIVKIYLALDNDGNIVIFNGTNDTDSFNFKLKIIGTTNDDGEIENVEIMIPLKYFLENS